jgi:plasmid maintenance system antidote protein VapI
MSRRHQLVAATVAAFAVANARQNHQRVASIIGCTSSFVSLLVRGQRKVPDETMHRLADGLRDHALRCERLADLIEAEVQAQPTLGRFGGLHGADGRFEARV